MSLEQIETIATLLFCPLGIAIFLFGLWNFVVPGRIQKNGIRTQAQIIDMKTTRYRGRVTYHYVLSFVVQDGHPIICKKKSISSIFRIGETINIYYSEKNPNKIHMENDTSHIINFVWMFLAAPILGLGLLPIIF